MVRHIGGIGLWRVANDDCDEQREACARQTQCCYGRGVVDRAGRRLIRNPGWRSSGVQAKLKLRLLDNYALGVTRTFLYELFDEYADPVGINFEDHFGLFTSAGAAKSLATALHSMQVILAESEPHQASARCPIP